MARPPKGPLNYTGSKRGEVINGTEFGDFIDGRGGNDFIYGYGGNDTLLGGDGADVINGGAGDDYINGNAGNDVIRGSTGTDALIGGSGADRFGFDYLGDSRAIDGIDTIHDFNPAEGDSLYVRPDDSGGALDPWYRVQEGAVTGTTKEFTLNYDAELNRTTLDLYLADGNPDNDPDMTIYLAGQHSTTVGMEGFVDFFG